LPVALSIIWKATSERLVLMGAISAGLPTIFCPAGSMLSDRYMQRGKSARSVGAGTHTRMFWDEYQAGKVSECEWVQLEAKMTRSPGTCNVMGTASTMASITEAIGMMPAYGAAIPAVDAERLRMAEDTGRIAVSLIGSGRTPAKILSEKAIENGLRVLLAIGGSTNAIIHLTAIAGRLGIPIDLNRLNALSDTTPVLVDLKPTGQGYMEDLHAAGGIPAIMRELRHLLHLDALTISGETIGGRIENAPIWVDRTYIKSFAEPVRENGGLVALFGNLAPRGAILKRSAATPELFEKEGRAIVFTSLEDMAARIDDPALDVIADDIVLLQNAGPTSASAMPEAGYLPIPSKLARAGLKDMLRISDARMSGTAYGTIVLHITPDAASGGPIGLVQTGDRIRLSVKNRSIELLVSAEELQKRAAVLVTPSKAPTRGYDKLYQQEILQADQGCDFRFLLPVGR